ncbi:MAG TPA: hypothetical protein VFE86_08585 [Ilumatobacteraceae bacterium]|nr:hypothetical protein [Ilumatobacteraceae bacterium]
MIRRYRGSAGKIVNALIGESQLNLVVYFVDRSASRAVRTVRS